jgi:hypothetical protein
MGDVKLIDSVVIQSEENSDGSLAMECQVAANGS